MAILKHSVFGDLDMSSEDPIVWKGSYLLDGRKIDCELVIDQPEDVDPAFPNETDAFLTNTKKFDAAVKAYLKNAYATDPKSVMHSYLKDYVTGGDKMSLDAFLPKFVIEKIGVYPNPEDPHVAYFYCGEGELSHQPLTVNFTLDGEVDFAYVED